jgi:hypothetical protein
MALPSGVSNPYAVSVPKPNMMNSVPNEKNPPAIIQEGNKKFAVPYNTRHSITPFDNKTVTATTSNGTKFMIPLNTNYKPVTSLPSVPTTQFAPTVQPKKGTIVYDSTLGSKSTESLYSSVIPSAPKSAPEPVYATVLGTRAQRNAAKALNQPPPPVPPRIAQPPTREINESAF